MPIQPNSILVGSDKDLNLVLNIWIHICNVCFPSGFIYLFYGNKKDDFRMKLTSLHNHVLVATSGENLGYKS